jgi:hypothetical protein
MTAAVGNGEPPKRHYQPIKYPEKKRHTEKNDKP